MDGKKRSSGSMYQESSIYRRGQECVVVHKINIQQEEDPYSARLDQLEEGVELKVTLKHQINIGRDRSKTTT